MITLDLRDKRITEHFEAIQSLRKHGFSDEELQAMYDRQLEKDAEDGEKT